MINHITIHACANYDALAHTATENMPMLGTHVLFIRDLIARHHGCVVYMLSEQYGTCANHVVATHVHIVKFNRILSIAYLANFLP